MGYKVNTNKELYEEELMKSLQNLGIEIVVPKDKKKKQKTDKK